MKKRNNKVIILTLIGIIFVVLLGIFILNYSKDDSSFSILEKKWINDNTSNVLDVSVYNDVPLFGKNGKGVIFDLLEDFTNTYGINFNKVSYLSNNSSNLRDIAFRIIDCNTKVTENDIMLYDDSYVLVSNSDTPIDRISDMSNINTLILSSDVGTVSSYLSDAKDISYIPKNSIEDIESSLNDDENLYALIPYNMYIDYIMKNDWNILFHLSDAAKKYVLTIKDKTLLNIMKKYYVKYSSEKQAISYQSNLLEEFFLDKGISEADKLGYNSNPYNVGYITYMPFEGREESDFVGTLSNYLSEFEDIYDVDFKLIFYDNIEELKKDLSSGELDLVFANFDVTGLNIDTIYTSSPFKEEYVVLSKDAFAINSIKSLNDREVLVVKDSYINSLVSSSGIKFKAYDNTDELLRNTSSDSTLILDKDTYDYYKTRKFGDYYEVYRGVLPNEYRFVIRDVNKNAIFAKMFSYYVMSSDYNSVKYKYNTNSKIYDSNLLVTFIISVVVILLILLTIFIIKKKKNKELLLRNNDKLKYIDTMTSLKNRTYLNYKIKEWDDNVIYPQAFVVIDLNNIKYINDSHGHEEGDTIIKKAASVLIVNQDANTDIIRTDGNEFLVYMVGYSEKDVVSYTRKIYKELKELPYGFGAAIGYSMIMDDVKTVDDAINEATIDMRNKKENS